jgi:hypothetical protein
MKMSGDERRFFYLLFLSFSLLAGVRRMPPVLPFFQNLCCRIISAYMLYLLSQKYEVLILKPFLDGWFFTEFLLVFGQQTTS